MDRVQRFKTPAYRQRINTARSYRRPKLPDPERAKIIKTWIISIASVLAVSILIYFIYFASFIKIKSLQIDVASNGLQARIQNDFTNYINSSDHGLPQNNFFFFSASKFSDIVATDPEVASVIFVHKHPWQSVEISIQQRIPEFVLQKWPDSYLIADDGAASIFLDQNSVPNPKLPMIIDTNINDTFKLGSVVLPAKEVNFITYLQKNLQTHIPLTIANYTISSANSEYLTVNMSNGLNVMFDYSSDPKDYLGRLQIIWKQFPQAVQNQLAYIDLRFDAYAYTCAKTQPCAQIAASSAPIPLPPSTTSSTIISPSPELLKPTGISNKK